jgi:hypothetical protein
MYSRAEPFPAHASRTELRVRTPPQIWLVSLGSGALVFGVTVLAHWLVYAVMLHERSVHMVGAVVAGGVTTLLIERLLFTQREARIAELERFRIIAEMNHHIRNALQTISYQRYVSASDAEAKRVKEAVDRIEWALEEILPNMQSTDRPR